MKKYISLIMALAMVFSLAIPAAAADVTGDTSKNVTASYTPTPVTYTVTVNAAENGTVTANPAEAAEGATVTLTVSPAEGYKLDTLAVKDASDGDVELKEDYTFVMPASNVTVTATFVEQVAPTYDVNVDADIENGTVIANKYTAEKDEEVVLTITPAEGYELETLTVSGVDVTADVQDGHYTITMGEAAVEVTATFKKINYTITIDSTIVNGTVTAPATATFGDSVALSVSADAKYELETLTVTRDDTDAEVTVTDKTFTMPAANVTVTATFKAMPITSVSISWGSMSFVYDDTIDEDTAKEKGWTCADGANQVTVTNGDESAITASVEYKQETDYETIKGYFAENSATASADLNLNATQTFTLTLDGKPENAITAGTKIGSVTVTIEKYNPVYLNISFEETVTDAGRTIGHSKHTVKFYDANGSLLFETAESSSDTETVAIPGGAATFALYYKPYDYFTGELPIDRNWYTTTKNEVPVVDSDVTITFTNYDATTVTVTAAQ